MTISANLIAPGTTTLDRPCREPYEDALTLRR